MDPLARDLRAEFITVRIRWFGLAIGYLLVNMGDLAERRGVQIDLDKLSEKLGGIPIVPAVANKEMGMDELKETIVNTCGGNLLQ